jgi:hypothetical protein
VAPGFSVLAIIVVASSMPWPAVFVMACRISAISRRRGGTSLNAA